MDNDRDFFDDMLSRLGSIIDSVCPNAYATKRFEYYNSVFDDLATEIAHADLIGNNPGSGYEAIRYADHIFTLFSMNKSTTFRFYPESRIIKKFIRTHPIFIKLVVESEEAYIMQRVSKDRTQEVFKEALISIHIKNGQIEYVEAVILDSDFISS